MKIPLIGNDNMDVTIEHDVLLKKLLSLIEQTSKDKVVALFFASLGSNKLAWRSGLSAYAASCHYYDHLFVSQYARDEQASSVHDTCDVCGNWRMEIGDSPAFMEDLYLNSGGYCSHNLSALCYILEYTLSLETPQVTKQDIKIFNQIIDLLNSDVSKKRQVQSKLIRIPGFKATIKQSQYLIETLGYCGILNTPGHIAPCIKFCDMHFVPRSSHKTDWSYPADLWNPPNGINKEMLMEWFGDYL